MGVDEAEKEKGRPEAGRGGSRRESSPLGWSELTVAQQEALRGLVRTLGQMGRELGRPRRRSCGVLADSPIDTERRNRVLLVDGARGSGKTTVLVTLVEALCALLQDPSACAGGRERARPEGVDAGSWQALLEELARELGGVAGCRSTRRPPGTGSRWSPPSSGCSSGGPSWSCCCGAPTWRATS